MADHSPTVVKAAEFLDSKVDSVSWLTADWRTKINLEILRMGSTSKCILGQLGGGYSRALRDLERAEGVDQLPPNTLGAFCDFTEAWREYITDTMDSVTVGSVWINSAGDERKVGSVFKDESGTTLVAYFVNHAWCVSTLEGFLASGEPKVEFTKGQEVLFKDYTGKAKFYYVNKKTIIRVEGSELNHSSLYYYVNEYGAARRGTGSQASRFQEITTS